MTCSFRSSWRLVLIGVEVWGWSRVAMGIPASIRAAWEKTGALTGRVPLWALAARQNADKMEMSECWVLALSRLRVESFVRITVSKMHTKTDIALKIKQLNKHMAHLASMLHRYTVPHLFPLLSFKRTSTHKHKDVMWARSRSTKWISKSGSCYIPKAGCKSRRH